MVKSFLTLAAIAMAVLGANTASADLVLNFSGDFGSNVVNWVASGSITVTQATPSSSSTVGAAPIGGAWNTGFDNDLGDLFQPAAASNLNAALSSPISYQLNSVEFDQIDAIDFTQSATAGGDDLQPDPPGTANYPTLSIGDQVSWTGSGTLTLTTETYNTFFIPGSFSNAIDGGLFVVNIAAATVPEPSSASLLCLGAVGLLARRRRRSLSSR